MLLERRVHYCWGPSEDSHNSYAGQENPTPEKQKAESYVFRKKAEKDTLYWWILPSFQKCFKLCRKIIGKVVLRKIIGVLVEKCVSDCHDFPNP